MDSNKVAQAIADGLNQLGWRPEVPNDKDEMKFGADCHEVQTIADNVIRILRFGTAPKSRYLISKIEQWSKHSDGAWVVMMIREFLHDVIGWTTEEEQNLWFNTNASVFGGLNAVEFVQKLVEIGNAESYADAWHDVLGIARRMYK